MFIEISYSQKSKTNGVKIITYPTFCPWALASVDFVFFLSPVSFLPVRHPTAYKRNNFQ